jgi:hypothetical protein
MDTPKPPATPTETDQPGHETRDMNLRAIIIFLVSLTILIILSLAAVGGLLAVLTNQQAGREITLPPLAQSQEPPEPRLQPSPRQELQALRAKETETLTTYGWVNKEAGVVRIPIERAMELALERGFPTHSAK